MAKLPLVAIIGRPNTGKSSLFNALLGEKRAIVSDIAGTTRDQVAAKIEREKVDYLLVDTAGIGGGSTDKELEDDVATQTTIALEKSDLILFTVNGREEITKSDATVADLLRRKAKRHVPIILVVTKCDNAKIEQEALPRAYELGVGDETVATSVTQGPGVGELEEIIERQLAQLHFAKAEGETDGIPRVALIGKPNVGKSSIVNALMSDTQKEANPRLVSSIPGTTRDASDTTLRRDDKSYVFVDTAGLRQQGRVDGDIEYYSTLRSIQAIDQSDVVLLVLAADEPISRQDKRIARQALDAGKGLLIILNKSDLLEAGGKEAKAVEIRKELSFCKFAPIFAVSAKDREGLAKIFPVIDLIVENRKRRLATRDLVRWYQEAIRGRPLGAAAGGKYITQADDIPPTFVLFLRDPKGVYGSQLRTLENNLRSTFAFDGVPIRWSLRESS
ncbi:MAG: ribosome biogenesis GTPase Der [Candidatus Peribacteraceae bacterium]|nr:ribosome biogenesis GTPase Der [Candidatus Peribacteraceae bacterium]